MSKNNTAHCGDPYEQQRQPFVGARFNQNVNYQAPSPPRIAKLGEPIDKSNRGFELLRKMGYEPGTSLGKTGNGLTEPVPIVMKFNRHGIGLESEQPKATRHRPNRHPRHNWKEPVMQNDVQRITVTIPKPDNSNETVTVNLMLPAGLLESCTLSNFGTISKKSKNRLEMAVKMFEKSEIHRGMKIKGKIARRRAILEELGRRAIMLAKSSNANKLSNKKITQKAKLTDDFVAEMGKEDKPQAESSQTNQLSNEEILFPEVVIVAKNFPLEWLDEEDVEYILMEILRRIDNVKPGETIPLLKTYVLCDGALHYSCANSETCKWLIKTFNGLKFNNFYELIAVASNDSKQSIKVCFTTQDVATEDSQKLLYRMNILNPGLIVKPWKMLSRKNYSKKQKFIFLIDLESAKKIQENNFTAFTGVDKGKFEIVDDDDFGEVGPERQIAEESADIITNIKQEISENKGTDIMKITGEDSQKAANGNINTKVDVQRTVNSSMDNRIEVNKEAEPMDTETITSNIKPEEMEIENISGSGNVIANIQGACGAEVVQTTEIAISDVKKEVTAEGKAKKRGNMEVTEHENVQKTKNSTVDVKNEVIEKVSIESETIKLDNEKTEDGNSNIEKEIIKQKEIPGSGNKQAQKNENKVGDIIMKVPEQEDLQRTAEERVRSSVYIKREVIKEYDEQSTENVSANAKSEDKRSLSTDECEFLIEIEIINLKDGESEDEAIRAKEEVMIQDQVSGNDSSNIKMETTAEDQVGNSENCNVKSKVVEAEIQKTNDSSMSMGNKVIKEVSTKDTQIEVIDLELENDSEALTNNIGNKVTEQHQKIEATRVKEVMVQEQVSGNVSSNIKRETTAEEQVGNGEKCEVKSEVVEAEIEKTNNNSSMSMGNKIIKEVSTKDTQIEVIVLEPENSSEDLTNNIGNKVSEQHQKNEAICVKEEVVIKDLVSGNVSSNIKRETTAEEQVGNGEKCEVKTEVVEAEIQKTNNSSMSTGNKVTKDLSTKDTEIEVIVLEPEDSSKDLTNNIGNKVYEQHQKNEAIRAKEEVVIKDLVSGNVSSNIKRETTAEEQVGNSEKCNVKSEVVEAEIQKTNNNSSMSTGNKVIKEVSTKDTQIEVIVLEPEDSSEDLTNNIGNKVSLQHQKNEAICVKEEVMIQEQVSGNVSSNIKIETTAEEQVGNGEKCEVKSEVVETEIQKTNN